MRRFRKEFGLKKARILRERLIPVSQRLKIGINRPPLSLSYFSFFQNISLSLTEFFFGGLGTAPPRTLLI